MARNERSESSNTILILIIFMAAFIIGVHEASKADEVTLQMEGTMQ